MSMTQGNVVHCNQCGRGGQAGHRFCSGCGAGLCGSRPQGQTEALPRVGSVRITTVVLGTILAALAVWYFFPGILDPESTSIFASKKRTSPIARAVGPRVIANGTKTVAEDEYVGLNVRLNSPSTLRVSVNQSRGPKFEVYVMSREGYQEFDRAAGNLFGGRFHHYESMAGVVELTKPYDNSERLPAGDYVVLLDNSDFGDTMPPMNFSNDTVVARVKVVAQ